MASTKNNSQTSRAILVIVGILVLTSLGYFAFKYFEAKQQNTEKDATIESLSNEVFELGEQISQLKIENEEQAETVIEKEQQLADRQREIQELMGRLDQARRERKESQARISQLEQQLAGYRQDLADKQAQIRRLQEENRTLGMAVDSLRRRNQYTEQQNEALQEENAVKARELEATRDIASRLKVAEFHFYPYNVKKGKRDKETSTFSKRTEAIEVCFLLLDNALAPKGERDLYLVIDDPDAQTLTHPADPGTFVHQGRNKYYSATTRIDYRGLSAEVCIVFEQPGRRLAEGPHFVQVYTDDDMIGTAEFLVK
ncbi:MAG: hypothetical protein OHK0039_07300 [Bacteroidia bacterium]